LRVSFLLHPHQHLLTFVFLVIAILTEVTWNLRVILNCVSLMAKFVKHLFMCL
jgi:hypothetical protein